MPGRRIPDKPLDERFCRRCQEVEPAIVVRSEPLCKDCFTKYLHTKVVKRLESFRVRNAEPGKQRKLLLPLTLDACSVALVHILSQHLQGQADRTGRTGFKLCILHVDAGTHSDDARSALVDLQARYPEHEYDTISLSHATSLEEVRTLFQAVQDAARAQDAEVILRKTLASTKSATGRQDLTQTLNSRLVVHYAKQNACEAVIWSDSTTKLAERTLAETAKGRGFALPWLTTDGESPHGLPFFYPLRDLLTKEIEAYIAYLGPAIDSCIVKQAREPIVSTKNTSIDDLMRQYFGSVEQEYPSIVANVVRTTGKLKAPALNEVEKQCELCNMPLQGHAPERSRLCYGCIRTLPQPTG